MSWEPKIFGANHWRQKWSLSPKNTAKKAFWRYFLKLAPKPSVIWRQLAVFGGVVVSWHYYPPKVVISAKKTPPKNHFGAIFWNWRQTLVSLTQQHRQLAVLLCHDITTFWRHELTPMLLWHLRVRRFFWVWRQFLQFGANLTLQKNHFFKSPNEFWNFRFGAKNWRQKNSANLLAPNTPPILFLAPKTPPIFWRQKLRQSFSRNANSRFRPLGRKREFAVPLYSFRSVRAIIWVRC